MKTDSEAQSLSNLIYDELERKGIPESTRIASLMRTALDIFHEVGFTSYEVFDFLCVVSETYQIENETTEIEKQSEEKK